MNELYEEIGQIADEAYRPMTFEELGELLDLDTSPRGVANHVRGAYHYFMDRGDERLAGKIAGTFTGADGDYSYV
ncbi:hypothetical protein ACT4R9_04885 [Ornithobacterium rhinotracheale]|uniref:hypothetical protein n=1 Tax=Ornithobacterium rhinotracheale TaxID=28251 RepID=UPI003FA4AA04